MYGKADMQGQSCEWQQQQCRGKAMKASRRRCGIETCSGLLRAWEMDRN